MALICLQCGAKQTAKGAVFCSVCGSMNLREESSGINITLPDSGQKTVPLDEYYRNQNKKENKRKKSSDGYNNQPEQRSAAPQTVPVSARRSSEHRQNDLEKAKPVLPNMNITPPVQINKNRNINNREENQKNFSNNRQSKQDKIQNEPHLSRRQNASQPIKPAPYTPIVKNTVPKNFEQKKAEDPFINQNPEHSAEYNLNPGNNSAPDNRRPGISPMNPHINAPVIPHINQTPSSPVNQNVNPYAGMPKQINIEQPQFQYGTLPNYAGNQQFNDGSRANASYNKKKSSAGIITGIVGAVIISLLAVLLPVALRAPHADVVKSADKSPGNYNIELPVSYSKGVISNGVYKNEWADISFAITSDWPEAEASQYESYETLNTECGFLSADPLFGKQLAFQFENLSVYGKSYTASDYLDALKIQYSNTLEQNGMTAYFEDYFNYTIAGKEYLTLLVQPDNGVILCSCVRILDDYAIVISASSTDEEEIVSVLSQIQPYN